MQSHPPRENVASPRQLIIAIDGPAGSGKSTTARLVASALNYLYIDSGAMYRALALAVLRAGVAPSNEDDVVRVTNRADVALDATFHDGTVTQRVRLDGADVTDSLRTADVDRVASAIAMLPAVRARLVALQRAAGAQGGIVMEGRDIGTVVFPEADVKVYLTADLAVRAERRLKQRRDAGEPEGSFEEIKQELAARDARDQSRSESPLRISPGSVVVDTSHCTIHEQVRRVLEIAEEIARR
jgi:cytidylate kinase